MDNNDDDFAGDVCDLDGEAGKLESWPDYLSRHAANLEASATEIPWWDYRSRWAFKGAVAALRHASKADERGKIKAQ